MFRRKRIVLNFRSQAGRQTDRRERRWRTTAASYRGRSWTRWHAGWGPPWSPPSSLLSSASPASTFPPPTPMTTTNTRSRPALSPSKPNTATTRKTTSPSSPSDIPRYPNSPCINVKVGFFFYKQYVLSLVCRVVYE